MLDEIGPEASDEDKGRRLRWLYRRNPAWSAMRAEYERLYGAPSSNGELEYIVKDAWIEGRKLAGWTYDYGAQRWLRADGSPVHHDDRSEWRHL